MPDRALPSSKLARLAELGGLLLIAFELLRIAVKAARLQWDFRVYLAAARAALAGLDPYRLENLIAVSRHAVPLPFLYPPLGLLPFLPLALLPGRVALAAWLSLKVSLLVALVILWKRVFVPRAGWFAIAAVAVFGSNAAALWDLRSGNVGLVEAFLLWAALACYVRGRRGAFAALVVAAAMFKLAPAVFLLLLLVPAGGQPARPRLLGAALGALLVLVLAPLWVGPLAHGREFLTNLGGDFPVGEANPSALAFFQTLLRPAGSTALSGAAALCWAAYVGLLLLVSARGLRALWRAQDPCAWAVAAVALYLLISPRPMAYGFVLGGGALVALIRHAAPGALARAGLVAIVSAQGVLWALQWQWPGMVTSHAPWLVLLALWLAALAAPRPGDLQARID
jgi:hypothetical protein